MNSNPYPRADTPLHSGHAGEILETVATLADRAGIALGPVEATKADLARVRQFKKARRAAEDPHALARRLASALVEGEMTLEEAATESMKAEALTSGSVLFRAIAKTEDLGLNRAFRLFGERIDQDQVMNDLRESVKAAGEQIKNLRPQLEGIASAEEANVAGPKIAAAWATYSSDLLPRWTAAHELCDLMRRYGWLPPLPFAFHFESRGGASRAAPQGPGYRSRFGRNDLRKIDMQVAKREGREIRLLLDEICDEWLPGGPYTEAEITEFEKLIDQEKNEPDPNGDPFAQKMRSLRDSARPNSRHAGAAQ